MSGDRYVISDQNAVYSLTISVVDWVDVFIRPVYKQIIVDSLNFCVKNKGMEIYCWCLMTNHLHLIARAREGFRMSDFLRDFKKFTAVTVLEELKNEPESRREWIFHRFEFAGKYLQRIEKYHFWRDSNHAVYLVPARPEMFSQRMNYIHQNPVKAGIVEKPEHYLYSSAVDYSGRKGLVDIKFA